MCRFDLRLQLPQQQQQQKDANTNTNTNTNTNISCNCNSTSDINDTEAILLSRSQDAPFFVAHVVDAEISFQGQQQQQLKQQQQQQQQLTEVACLVVFVPPALVESALFSRHTDNNNNKDDHHHPSIENITNENHLLNLIHPRLIQGKLKVKGVIIISGEPGFPRRNPADLVLLDLSAMEGSIEDLFMDLNGESLSFRPACILKMIAISTITLTCSNTITDTDNSSPAFRIPPCPVCLHRIDPCHLDHPKPHHHQRCSETFCPSANSNDTCYNQRLLHPWDNDDLQQQQQQQQLCVACHVIQVVQQRGTGVFCNRCAMQETLWVCLTCGFVGCGRYSQRHAAEHFDDSRHPFSLELATLRIWNYARGEFAQRGDLLECPSIRKHHPILTHLRWDSEKDIPKGSEQVQAHEQVQVQEQEQTKVGHSKSFADDNAGSGAAKLKYEYEGTFAVLPSSESPKKATMIGEEYEALLQSALEDQAQHYESEISRLRAALAADQINLTKLNPLEMQHIESLNSDIARLRTEVDHVGRQLLDAQAQEAGYNAASKRLLREQGVAKELLQRIQEESSKEYDAGKSQVEELKQQLADLTGNLRMIHQFSQNEELNNAQIFGTTSSEDRPNAAKKTGKKNRRSFRK